MPHFQPESTGAVQCNMITADHANNYDSPWVLIAVPETHNKY